jgi:hypothetical protein
MSDKPDYDKFIAEHINTTEGRMKIGMAMSDVFRNRRRPKLLCSVCLADCDNLEDHCKEIGDADHLILFNFISAHFVSVNSVMGKQLQHIPSGPGGVGGPCKRCGLVYSIKTAYTPCFEEGDTFEIWQARQNEVIPDLDDADEEEDQD